MGRTVCLGCVLNRSEASLGSSSPLEAMFKSGSGDGEANSHSSQCKLKPACR